LWVLDGECADLFVKGKHHTVTEVRFRGTICVRDFAITNAIDGYDGNVFARSRLKQVREYAASKQLSVGVELSVQHVSLCDHKLVLGCMQDVAGLP
jgi:hypothetical protein